MDRLSTCCLLFIICLLGGNILIAQNNRHKIDPSRLDTGTRIYDVLRGDQVVSEMRITLSREALAGQDAYFSRRLIRTPLGDLEQDVVFDARTLEPIGAEGQSQSRYKVDYIYHKGRVIGTITTPDSIVKQVDRRMNSKTLFPWMYEYHIALSDLDSGKVLKTPVLHTDTDMTYSIEAEVLGDTVIVVPADTFSVYPIRLKGNSPSTIYVRREAPHITVKQSVDHMPLRIELRSYPKPASDTIK